MARTSPPQTRKRTLCPGPLTAKRHRELRLGIGVCQASTGAFQFYGPASNLAFLQAFYQRIHHNTDGYTSVESPSAMHIWGVDKFVFSPEATDLRDETNALHAFIPKDIGDCFIMTYFRVCHPQFPFLVRAEIERAWASLWEPPEQPGAPAQACQGNKLTERNIVLMVLAIGAIMASLSPGKDAKVMERWANHLSSRVQLRAYAFEDTSLGGVHLLLLKSIFGIQLMRPNDAQIYASHAAINALALGMNRAQVANGPRPEMHRLRVTFYSLYTNERLATLCSGRPSCLREDLIDVALPEDLPSSEPDENTNLAFVRAMVALAKIADRISTGIYSAIGADAATIDHTGQECDSELDEVTRAVPPFLHFFDTTMPPSRHTWQEIQRTHLGLAYYHCRILIYRPLVCFASMHSTNAEAAAEATLLGISDLQGSIARAMEASEALIGLALEAFTTRVRDMHQDAGVAYYVMGACLTLLYRVLDGPARTSSADATTIFNLVQDGIRCLDLMNHHGPRASKMTLSERIVTAAKDAFWSAREDGAARAPRALHPGQEFDGQGDDNVDGAGPVPELDIQGTDDNLDMLLAQFPWLETAPSAPTTDDTSPAFPARTDAVPASADGLSSQNAYPSLFRTASSSARALPTALYGFGSHPWPAVVGGNIDGGHENSMNGISWDLV
ncbi:hypothetical protein diail_10877 [Diaporthe ilicicola]|nr:hypothetical protein diail_10877 [Diaporthe ilicicola]